jgi:hypothetical protein
MAVMKVNARDNLPCGAELLLVGTSTLTAPPGRHFHAP